ncbi:MAG: EamA family transporter, partial [Bdellovibrionota bacterium]
MDFAQIAPQMHPMMPRATPFRHWSVTLRGPAWIALAAFLWGTDSLFRFPVSRLVDPSISVLVEHVLGFLSLCLFSRAFGVDFKFRPSRQEWLGLAFVGGGASAFATLAYTLSFTLINPSVAVLLQKLQP